MKKSIFPKEYARQKCLALKATTLGACRHLKAEQAGQGTTEYAILVGVLVVIAIIAVIAFRDNLQTLWQSITEGINSL